MDAVVAVDTIDLCSPEIDKLVAALIAAEAEFDPVLKDRLNSFFKNRYPTLHAFQTATRPALAAHGLIVTQLISVNGQGERLHTRLIHVSGQWLQSTVRLTGAARGPQIFGSELTYIKRYCYAAILNISAEQDDDDADAAQNNQPASRASSPSPPPSPPPQRTIKQWLDDLAADLSHAGNDPAARAAIMTRKDVHDAPNRLVGEALARFHRITEPVQAVANRVNVPPPFEALVIDCFGDICGPPITDPVIFAKTLLIGVDNLTPEQREALIGHNEGAIDQARAGSGEAAAILAELDEMPLPSNSGQTSSPTPAAVPVQQERGKPKWPAYVADLRADLERQPNAALPAWTEAQRETLLACPIGQRALALQAILAAFDTVRMTQPSWLDEIMRAKPTSPPPPADTVWVENALAGLKTMHTFEDFEAFVRSSVVQATMARLQKSNPALFDRANNAFVETHATLTGAVA